MDFEAELKKRTDRAESIIKKYLPEITGPQATVIEAMDYSVGAGGKRLRPVIMMAAYEMCGGKGELAEPFCAAIEMIHNYSLVHDDLPEMDNDMIRRGLPSTHAKYGAGMAVLAGDGLLNSAFETALKSTAFASSAEDNANILKALAVLADRAGIYGMIGGQAVDVEAEEKDLELSEADILFVYENKTSALLQASMVCGALLAGADGQTADTFSEAARCLGVAFQIQDDILDVTGTTEEIGKPAGSDERNGKKTYLAYLGMEGAEKEQRRLSAQAHDLVAGITVADNEDAAQAVAFLTALIDSLVDRRK